MRTKDKYDEAIYELEQWKSVKTNYEVSDHGRIRNSRNGRILKPWAHKSGHLYVRLGGGKSSQVHRLVALAFIGAPPSSRHECCHKDGIPTSNHSSNLYWGTRAQNINDYSAKHRKFNKSCTTFEVALQIRSRLDGVRGTQKQLSREFGLSVSTVNRIALGRTYKKTTCEQS